MAAVRRESLWRGRKLWWGRIAWPASEAINVRTSGQTIHLGMRRGEQWRRLPEV